MFLFYLNRRRQLLMMGNRDKGETGTKEGHHLIKSVVKQRYYSCRRSNNLSWCSMHGVNLLCSTYYHCRFVPASICCTSFVIARTWTNSRRGLEYTAAALRSIAINKSRHSLSLVCAFRLFADNNTTSCPSYNTSVKKGSRLL